MSLRWKDSVKFDELHPALILALWRLEPMYDAHGLDCWLTSGNDSEHMIGSKHYTGRAVDIRTHTLPAGAAEQITVDLRRALGPQFKVLFEDAGTPNEHLHVQFNGL